jgi:hypothetical protein
LFGLLKSWIFFVDLSNKFTSTETELTSTKSTVADLKKQINGKIKINFHIRKKFKKFCFLFTARTREVVDIGKMPTSCADLQRMGQILSGFFSVKGPTKMEMIYCDFQNGTIMMLVFTDR